MDRQLELDRRGPLDNWADRLAASSSDSVQVEVAPVRTVVNLRGAPADQSLITDAQRALGVELPLVPNRWRGNEQTAAVWLGPDEWLVIAPDGKKADIEQAMRAARPNDPWLAVVDVSHNCTSILLSGTGVRDLLAKGCTLDLRADAFCAGECAQSTLAKSQVLLRCLYENRFELWVRNSFARYAAAWLLDACA